MLHIIKHWPKLASSALFASLRPVYSDATQLDVEWSWVELRRYRHPHWRNSTVADDRQCNWPSWIAYSQSARSRSVVFPVLHCDVWYTNQRRSFPDKCFLAPLLFYRVAECFGRYVFFHNSINFSSNSSLQNSIPRQTRQNTSYMTSWPTNWVNWVTTFRTIGDSSRCERVDNSTFSWVELSCVAINGLLGVCISDNHWNNVSENNDFRKVFNCCYQVLQFSTYVIWWTGSFFVGECLKVIIMYTVFKALFRSYFWHTSFVR